MISKAKNPAVRMAVTAALISAAVPTWAVDFGGYFRSGPGGTSVPNTSRQCYGLAGPGLKYRLGNECDTYGEFKLSEGIKSDALEYKATLMVNLYNPGTDTGSSSFGANQMFVEVKGFDFAPSANFWVGKRFYGRNDVHIVDTFFTNMSGVGAGVDSIDAGPGKLGIAYFKTDTLGTDSKNYGNRFHVDYYDLPVNPGGKLRIVGTLTRAKYDAGTSGTPPVAYAAGTSGSAVSVEHNQANIGGSGINNALWLQYASGSAGLNQSFGTLDVPSSNKSWRIIESPSWQIGSFGGQALAMYQEDKTSTGTTKSSSLGGRASIGLARQVKLLAEVGLSSKTPSGQSSQRLNKLTVGPALSLNDQFWTRPELRLYVTRASWNTAAGADPANGLPTGRRSGNSYGAQVELWF